MQTDSNQVRNIQILDNMNEPNKDEPKISFDVFMTFKTWELEHDVFILKQKIKARNVI